MGYGVDVIVVGSGVIAKACALEIGQSGRTVALFGPRSFIDKSATNAAGAMLGAFAEYTAEKDDPVDRHEAELRIRSGRIWQSWFDHLADGTSQADAVGRGTFIVATNTGLSDLENVEFIKARADEHGEANEWADPREVAGLKPHRLSRAQRVLFLPDEGYIDSEALRLVLDEAIRRDEGITWIDEPAQAISLEGNHPVVTGSDGTRASCEHLLIAAGVQSIALLETIGLPTVQGTPILLGGRGASMVVATDVHFAGVLRTPNREFACGSHVVPLDEGRVYLGATNRLETTEFSHPRPSLGELHSLAHSLAHEINVQLRTAEVVDVRAGFRPVSSDGYPIYGGTAHPQVFVATGTYRNGILMAPAIAQLVAAEIAGSPTGRNPFSPIGREALFRDRDVRAMMLASLRQVVSFVQEPHGNLPFDRATELEALLAAFLGAATLPEEASHVLEHFDRLTKRYPISEAMPLLMYELTGQ